MLRIYLADSSGLVTVYDYLSYQPIAFFDYKENKEGAIKKLKELLGFTNKDYIKFILDTHKVRESELLRERDKEREDWIKSAWVQCTANVLNTLGIKLENKEIKNIKDILAGIEVERLKAKRKPLPKRKHNSTISNDTNTSTNENKRGKMVKTVKSSVKLPKKKKSKKPLKKK